MALSSKSLITYGLEVTSLNQNIDFKITSLGATLTAVVPIGFYSVTGIAFAVANALQSIDSANIYSVTVDRTILGGTQNRITISTNGSFLSLLFGTGPHATTSIATLIGFNPADYTGLTTYTGNQSSGTTLTPDYIGYNFLSDQHMARIFGAVNISASGLKEAVTFNTQYFIEVDYKYEPSSKLLQWKNFFTWAIQQRPYDYTPEISNPTTVYNVTLETTQEDPKGLGYRMNEMLPDFPNFYQTGPLKFRIIANQSQFAIT